MIIECFPCGPLETNGYIVACDKTKKAMIVDAPLGFYSEIQEKKYDFEKIILTHSHWDHVAGLSELKENLQLPVYIHEEDADNIRIPGSDGLPKWIEWNAVEPDGYLKDGDVFLLGELSIKVIHTPGHSPGCICLYIEKEKVLLSGDTLFAGCIGRLDLPTGCADRMWPSLKKLSSLPPDTKVFPGHGGSTLIGKENWLADPKKRFY